MNQIPLDICITIWEFAGLNTVFLNKDLIKFIKQKKRELERNPVIIYYRLVKLKESNYSYRGYYFQNNEHMRYNRRPSIAVDKYHKNIILNGNCPIGELLDKTTNIKPSKILHDKLIPCSTCSYSEDRRNEGYWHCRVTYWELFEIYCDDAVKAKDYIRLYPYNGEIVSLSRYCDLFSETS